MELKNRPNERVINPGGGQGGGGQEGGGNGAGGEDAEGGGGTLRRTCAGEGEIVREALALGDIQIIQIKYHNSIYK